jgi:anti-sigma B factor antagonist
MELKTREELDGKVVVIETPERLDASIASDVRGRISELVEEGKYMLVIDLGKTEFMDSSGLGSLVARIAVTRSNNGDIRLASAKPQIHKLFEITHLNKVFKFYDDVNSAVESFR